MSLSPSPPLQCCHHETDSFSSLADLRVSAAHGRGWRWCGHERHVGELGQCRVKRGDGRGGGGCGRKGLPRVLCVRARLRAPLATHTPPAHPHRREALPVRLLPLPQRTAVQHRHAHGQEAPGGRAHARAHAAHGRGQAGVGAQGPVKGGCT